MSLTWNPAITGLIQAATLEGIREAAYAVEAAAVQKAPFRDGDLRNSALTTVGTMGDKPAAAVSFNVIYAARQHEETGWNHPNGGEAKYLENAANELKPQLLNLVANHIRSKL